MLILVAFIPFLVAGSVTAFMFREGLDVHIFFAFLMGTLCSFLTGGIALCIGATIITSSDETLTASNLSVFLWFITGICAGANLNTILFHTTKSSLRNPIVLSISIILFLMFSYAWYCTTISLI